MSSDYVVHLPTASRPTRRRRALQWAKLVFITAPSLGPWLLLALVYDLVRGPAGAKSRSDTDSVPRSSPALVPAQVGSSAGVAIGKDNKPAIDRG